MNTSRPSQRVTKLHDELQDLPIGRLAKRLRPLWPAIEAKLAEGASRAEVLALLNQHGFALSFSTFKTYLQRHRRQRQRAPMVKSAQAATRAPSTTLGVMAPASTPLISVPQAGATRPPTFDYDPKGIPDLLK